MNAANKWNTRWRWWYEGIADALIENPSVTTQELCDRFSKAPSTISQIRNSDNFKTYYAARRAEWTKNHDHAIIHKLTKVAEASLDTILTVLEKKKDTIPLVDLQRGADSALQRLGFGVAPSVPPGGGVVNNGLMVVAVNPDTLAEARAAIRQVEQKRLAAPTLGSGAGETIEMEIEDVPLPIRSQ